MAQRSRPPEELDEIDDIYPSLFADVYPLPPSPMTESDANRRTYRLEIAGHDNKSVLSIRSKEHVWS